MPSPELTIATLLFLGTVFAAYLAWYLFRGRHLRRRRALEAAAETNTRKSDKVLRKASGEKVSKVGKDSYCYPKINDVMGYEFVNVVSVPEELTLPKQHQPVQEEPENPADTCQQSWGRSSGTGFVTESNTAVSTSGSARRQTDNPTEDDTYPEQRKQQVQTGEGETPQDEEVSRLDISTSELQEIRNLGGQEWPDGGDEDNVNIPQALLASMQDSPDVDVQYPETDEEIDEDERLRREQDAYQRQLEEAPDVLMNNYVNYDDNDDQESIADRMDGKATGGNNS